MRVLLLGMTVHEATVGCRGDLPNGFTAAVRTHGVAEFLPRERRGVQMLDDGEEQLLFVLFGPLDHFCDGF